MSDHYRLTSDPSMAVRLESDPRNLEAMQRVLQERAAKLSHDIGVITAAIVAARQGELETANLMALED